MAEGEVGRELEARVVECFCTERVCTSKTSWREWRVEHKDRDGGSRKEQSWKRGPV